MNADTAPIPIRRGTPRVRRRAFVEVIMGMPISLHIKAIDVDREEIAAAAENVFATLRKVDDLFSTWRADSELRQLQVGDIAAGDCHPWQAEVLELALEAEEFTDGLFTAWHTPGGGAASRGGRAAYDPTGIVKGWAVEKAAEMLRVVPGISFYLSAGGDLVVGTGPGVQGSAPAWLIGIESPFAPGTYAGSVEITAGAVATSGSAARGAHVIDPRTGLGVERPGSATVVGPDLVWADVWATAAYVDPAEARRLMAIRAPEYHLAVL